MNLRALARGLGRIRLVDAERDLIERLDRIDVAAGSLRFAATSAKDVAAARRLVASLGRAAPGLEHGLRVIEDDRPALLARSQPLVARALAERPAPLALAFTWRRGERPPPRRIARKRIGPLLGYPPCCVRFEEARRAKIVRAEARGMIETWGATSVAEVLRAIDARVPYLCEDVGDDEARFLRLSVFPFVSYVPCPRCARNGPRCPSRRQDERRRELARSISPRYARAIELRFDRI
jgi:hypothetical protein